MAWCENITVEQSNFINAGGISSYYTLNSQIIKSNFSDNYHGIYLYASQYIKILNSSFSSNENGIYLDGSDNNIIVSCNLFANNNGITLHSYSEYNQISNNNITSNNCGISVYDSKLNLIYHNNFLRNKDHIDGSRDASLTGNHWSKDSQGNYWDDYTGSDIEGDNIGDEPYKMHLDYAIYTIDKYPLIYPFTGSLPPDITPPHFSYGPIVMDPTLTVPRDRLHIRFETSERGHYEIIIDTDGKEGFDNVTDTVLISETSTGLSQVYWNGTYNENNYVSDGDYKVQIMIWDSKDNVIENPFDAGIINIQVDQDGDTFMDVDDAFPLDPTESSDFDSDGIGDNSDPDWDNDHVENEIDAFPWNFGEWKDSDGDGIGDNADSDDNGNNIPDFAEIPLVILIIVMPIGLIYYANKLARKEKKEK